MQPDVDSTTQTLRTLPQIARHLGISSRRVDYAVAVYHIEPTQRAGIVRLFDQQAADRVASVVKRIERGKAVSHV